MRSRIARQVAACAAGWLLAAGPLFGQTYRIIPREVLDSIARPVAAADSPMRFEQETIDAGTIGEEDAPSRYIFRWENCGTEPVTVLDVRTGCGCAVATYDRQPVGAGETGTITITYHPKGHPGAFQRRIQVLTRTDGAPAAVLTLKGQVTPSARPIHAYPHAMGDLRLKQTQVRMDPQRSAVERIEVINAGDTPLRIGADPKLLPGCLTVRCEPEVLEAGATGDLEIGFDPAQAPEQLPRQLPILLEGIALPPGQRTIYVRFDEE